MAVRCLWSRQLLPDLEPSQNTLLPFLYQTRTILFVPLKGTQTTDTIPPTPASDGEDVAPRRKALKSQVSRSVAGKHYDGDFNLRSRKTWRHSKPHDRSGGYVPFEGATGSVHSEHLAGPTTTSRERNVFAQLLQKRTEPGTLAINVQTDNFDAASQSLDAPANSLAKTGTQPSQNKLAEADDAFWRDVQTDLPQDLLKEARSVYQHVITLLDKAESDVSLWRQLKSNVLQRIESMDFNASTGKPSIQDSGKVSHKRGPKRRAQDEVQIWSRCLPPILRAAMVRLQQRFPFSSLSLSVLPALKTLGPSAFALGATTGLYNQHLRLLLVRDRDIYAFNQTIEEMEAEVYQFNSDTHDIILAMLSEAQKATRGHYGQGVQELWTMARRQRAITKLKQWAAVVEQRLEDDALRRARGAESGRNADDGMAMDRAASSVSTDSS